MYYGHLRHRQFCSPFSVPCISILLSIVIPQASIRPQTSTSNPHISISLLSPYISPNCFPAHLDFSCVGTHAPVVTREVSRLNRIDPLRMPLSYLYLSIPRFWLIRSSLRRDPWSYLRRVFRSLHPLYNVYLFLDVRYVSCSPASLLPLILQSFSLSVHFTNAGSVVFHSRKQKQPV